MAAAAAAKVIMVVLVATLAERAAAMAAAAARGVWVDEEGGHNETAIREVSYDGRALILDGTRRMLFSGDIHYPRSTPEVYIYYHTFAWIVVSWCHLALIFFSS
jgi:hypothetical protein